MKYNKSIVKAIRVYLRRGTPIYKVCKKVGIHESTFYLWRETRPEFRAVTEATKQMLADDMDEALLRLAKGYTANEVTRESVEGRMRITKKVTKKIAPDLAAIKYFKNNIDPGNWKERKQMEHGGELKLQHIIPAEVREILDEVKKNDQG